MAKKCSPLIFCPCQHNEVVKISAKQRSVWMKTSSLLGLFFFSCIASKNSEVLSTHLIFVFLGVLEVAGGRMCVARFET